jgi:hypothetical protein
MNKQTWTQIVAVSVGAAVGASLFCAALSSCTGPNPGSGQNPLPDLSTPEPDLSDPRGAVCSDPVKKTIDPTGGRLSVGDGDQSSLAGTSLLVPPAALSAATVLGITCGRELATGSDEQAVGPSARFLPLSQILLSSVTITLPYNPSLIPDGERPRLAMLRGATREILPDSELTVDKATKSVSFDTGEFGDFQVIGKKAPNPGGGSGAVDILFVVDNSPSMTPKQRALATGIGALIRKLDQSSVKYHIGVVSTDVGSQVGPGKPWGAGVGACDTFSGDDGVLQDQACLTRTVGTPDARSACAAQCPDAKFVPNDGSRYIWRDGGKTNVPADLRLDPGSGGMIDYGPETAFKCMALIGDGGCGLESPLDATRRALDGHRTENSGFLRKDSLLAVVYLTDEDDCSVQLSRRGENNPMTRDCSTPDQDASYDCYNLDYRCLARSLRCDQPMNATGSKTGCKERVDNYLEPVSRYATFLKSLRPADKLLVSGLWTRPSLDEGGKLVVSRLSGSSSVGLNRGTGSDAGCYSSVVGIFGQAQRRLTSFAKSFAGSREYSICDVDSYGAALSEIAQAIVDRVKK